MSTGPGRPLAAVRKASRMIFGASAGLVMHQVFLATVLQISAISTHWKASLPNKLELALPVMAISGMESACAVYRPVTKLVAPGPEVQIAMASLPEARK